jgi:hypothetical protein
MWLVLGQDGDVDGQWIADGLGALAAEPVRLLTASTLVHGTRWEHRVGPGGASSRLVLPDGTVLDSAAVDAVVNRLVWLGAEGFAGASPRDREYATAELQALGLSWVESLGPRVLNRPAGGGILGAWRTEAHWRALARSVGLRIVPYTLDGEAVPVPAAETADEAADAAAESAADLMVLVVDGEVFDKDGVLTGPERSALSELQRISGQDLIEARLTPGEGRAFCGVGFLPNLRRFGDPGLDVVFRALLRRRRARP